MERSIGYVKALVYCAEKTKSFMSWRWRHLFLDGNLKCRCDAKSIASCILQRGNNLLSGVATRAKTHRYRVISATNADLLKKSRGSVSVKICIIRNQSAVKIETQIPANV